MPRIVRYCCSQLNLEPCGLGRTGGDAACSSATVLNPSSTNLLPVLGDLDTGRPFSCGTISVPLLVIVEGLLFEPPEKCPCGFEAVSGDTGLGTLLLLLPLDCRE